MKFKLVSVLTLLAVASSGCISKENDIAPGPRYEHKEAGDIEVATNSEDKVVIKRIDVEYTDNN